MALAPASALAQSAGDDQYVDPLDGLTGGGSGSGSGTAADGSAVGAGEAGVAGSAEADVNGLPSELARTGVELPLLAGAGVLLLAGGIGIRRISGERR
ncbi:MAG: hypothetical protein ACKOH7_05575 [Solirubrobacterales bacterium]